MNTEKIVLHDANLWHKWALATAIGVLISDYLNFIVSSQASTQIFALLDILAAGLIIGALQWLFVLRPSVQKSQKWIWVSAVGWAIGWITGNLFGSLLFFSLFVHGTILGVGEWFFFVRNMHPQSFSWIFVNSLGLPIAYVLSWNVIFPMLSVFGYDGTLSGPADSLVRGTLFGVITGVSMQRLLSSSTKSAENILGAEQRSQN